MNVEVLLKKIAANVAILEERGASEVAELLARFAEIVKKETSETLDREALLKQIQILSEQATLPVEQRKSLLITSALFYISLFSSVSSIGSFLIAHKKQIAKHFGL